MRSDLFSRVHEEVGSSESFRLQSGNLLKATLGDPLIATRGSVIAHRGNITFDRRSAGLQVSRLRRVVTGEHTPVVTISGQGEVFLGETGRNVFLIDLEGLADAVTIADSGLLAFQSSLEYEVHRVKQPGVPRSGSFHTMVHGSGRAAITCHGTPLILDCSQQPTYIDTTAALCWSANLQPTLERSGDVKPQPRGQAGSAFQYAFHGPGFVVVQPSRGYPRLMIGSTAGTDSEGFLGDVMSD